MIYFYYVKQLCYKFVTFLLAYGISYCIVALFTKSQIPFKIEFLIPFVVGFIFFGAFISYLVNEKALLGKRCQKK